MSGESSTTLCFQCRSPIRSKPRVDVDSTMSINSSNVVVDSHGIRELILLSEKDLDDYDAEITRLQSQITYAQTQKQRLQEYKTTLVQSLLSPFRFPNEILFMVLESACENNLLQEYPWGGLESEQPRTRLSSPAITYLPALAISSVCIQWRSLALALPQLWSRFRVETAPAIFECDPQEVSNGGSGFIKTLQLYLDRSTDDPLTIDLETKGRWRREMIIPPAVNLLLEYTHRWKAFKYTGDYWLDKITGFERQPLSFPILENLTLNGVTCSIVTADLDCFTDAPKLRTLETNSSEREFKLPLNQLTYLGIHSPDAEILTQCLNLTVLKLWSHYYLYELEGDFTPNMLLSMNRLESFTFVYDTDSSIEDQLSSLILPSLTELVIYPDGDFHDKNLIWSRKAFSEFISRSSCNLTTLSIGSVVMTDRDLIDALQLLTSLTNLGVDDKLQLTEGESPITSYFLSSLHLHPHNSPSSAPPLVPRLGSLSIVKFNGTFFDDAAFVEMVSSRWFPAGINSLRSVVLRFHQRKINKDIYKPLYDLDRRGMKVVITGNDPEP